MPDALRTRLGRWLVDNRWLIALFIAALVVRLHWNLVVHPLGDYVYSDMRGYVRRADSMFGEWRPREYHAFFPYGTHLLLFAFKWIARATVGHDSYPFIAVMYAVMGAAVVAVSYAFARRMTQHAWVGPAVGLVLVVYYPLISLGGYMLSEIPFTLCMVTSTLLVFRLVDHGKQGDAWLLGLVVAAGFALRPQILLSAALLFGFWLVFRKRMPKLRLRLLLLALVPVVIVIALSAARLHYHTGRWGMISENGRLNQLFGQCHNKGVVAHPDRPERSRTRFAPPPNIQLNRRDKRQPDAWVRLNPAIGLELRWSGYIGDRQILDDFIAQCHAVTGVWGQVKFRVVNVILLWRYNLTWPDSGKPQWRSPARWWAKAHERWLALPALLALLSLAWPRKFLRTGLVALQLVAILLIAILYLGGTRLRTPYDPFIIALALQLLATVLAGLWWLMKSLRNRGNPDPV